MHVGTKYNNMLYGSFVLLMEKVQLLFEVKIFLRRILMGELKRWIILIAIGLMILMTGTIGCSNKGGTDTSNTLSSSKLKYSPEASDSANAQNVNESPYVLMNMAYDGEGDESEVNEVVATPTPSIADRYYVTPEDMYCNEPSSLIPKLKTTIEPVGAFYSSYYVDNKGYLNVFNCEYSSDSIYKYNSVRLSQEQKDGSIKSKIITWNKAAAKTMNLVSSNNQKISFIAQWVDEKTGDLYSIVSKWGFKGKDYPSYVYGIHPNGKLFVHSQVEHHLKMDKISSRLYAPGYYINYIGQKDGIAYFNYRDKSRYAVLSYSMKQHQFIKQIFTDNYVLGIINNQFISVDMNHMLIGSIPDGKKEKLANGNTISTGKSVVSKAYILPAFKSIEVNGKYVYLLTGTQYQRVQPGKNNWDMLADVSEIIKQGNEDLYLSGFIPEDSKNFSVLWYEDCGAGFYIEKYNVKK